MIGRKPLPTQHYPLDPWVLTEIGFHPENLGRTETMFALGNGHVGVRGSYGIEGPADQMATLIAGFHETWPMEYEERAFGFATTGQQLIRVPDATRIAIEVDGEPLRLADGDHHRRLDLRTGVLEHVSRWATGSGIAVEVLSERIVSLADRRLIATSWQVTTDRMCQVALTSSLTNHQDIDDAQPDGGFDPRRGHSFDRRVLECHDHMVDGSTLRARFVTSHSRIGLAAEVRHQTDADADADAGVDSGDRMTTSWRLHAAAETPLSLTKYAAYATHAEPAPDIAASVTSSLDDAVAAGFPAVRAAHIDRMEEFWSGADIAIDGPTAVQRAVRWSVFQLMQASASVESAGIPAKGLTGQAYGGHSFWDTEIYVLPALISTGQPAAKAAIRWRHQILPQARDRATELGHRGALFPWRTIDGHEASSYFPAGTAQYHINAAIAYAVEHYVAATGHREMLWTDGLELLVETARLWVDLGFMDRGTFHIYGVTGPDEYTAIVNDNAYTNLMARHNLRLAAAESSRMQAEDPERFSRLAQTVGLTEGEVAEWESISAAIHTPHDEALAVTPQDDSFLSKPSWDFAGTADRRPLMLHFHPLNIYRHRVLKQSDVVLAQVLLPNQFDSRLKKANFEYYDPITIGDSSLSAGTQAIAAAEAGYPDRAMSHFLDAAFIDLDDIHGNTADGVHLAAAGSVWMAVVHGFAGMRRQGDTVTFDPRLPAEWQSLRFQLAITGAVLAVELDHRAISLTADGPLRVSVRGVPIELSGDPVVVELE